VDIGVPELLVILAIVMLIVGPGRLPDIGAALGRTIHDFRQAIRDEDKQQPEQPGKEDNQSRPQ
jgi:sec-independent protein translocase protein TatA